MRQQIRAMSEVRDCWMEARRMLTPRASAGELNSAADGEISRCEWNA